MKHIMKLKNNNFVMIEKRIKTIEMRLYDDKRKMIQIGDQIEFLNEQTGRILNVKVLKLHCYKNFEELYKQFDKQLLGYHKDDVANYNDMSQYYSNEDINKYGVVGIEIELLKD